MLHEAVRPTVRPFLLLQSRPEDAASDDEYQAFFGFSGLAPTELIRLRMDQGELPEVNLEDYSAILMGGGPANFAYDEAHKTDMQKAFEPWLFALLTRIIVADKPFLGACLGLGALIKVQGGAVTFEHPEPLGATEVSLTPAGRSDPLLAGLPPKFEAFVGHKEGSGVVPDGAVELARSAACIQMIRIGQNVYGTQFHPELDAAGLALRIGIYRHAGYFPPDDAEALIAAAWGTSVTEPVKILQRFMHIYKQEA